MVQKCTREGGTANCLMTMMTTIVLMMSIMTESDCCKLVFLRNLGMFLMMMMMMMMVMMMVMMMMMMVMMIIIMMIQLL